MMPLSFAAILGGMTTLIGSSTNLLVSNELAALGEEQFGFFSFTIPGLVVAGAGMIYVLFVAPRLLGAAKPKAEGVIAARKHFFAEITVEENGTPIISDLKGRAPEGYSMLDITAKIKEAKDKTPYVVVCLQECERMNTLLG